MTKTIHAAIWTSMMLMMTAVCFAEDTFSFWEDRISAGGEVRTRVELYDNFYTPNGLSSREDELWLLRTKLHLDFHPNDVFRVYIEGQDSREFIGDWVRRRAVPNGFVDDLDLFQAFVELNDIGGSPFSFKAGRQVLTYGKQRLIGGFLWNNNSRSFDAIKLNIDLPDFYGGSIDVFAGEAVTHDYHNFNDILDNDSTLYGIYSTWNDVPMVDFLEAYYLLRDNDTADDEVHTLGLRSGRKYDSNIDWEIEVAGQVGDFRGLDHAAFASHIEVGYTYDIDWSPRAALAYSFATGDDDPTDGDHGTFDNLYPTNHLHYGQTDMFSWRNVHDVELDATASPMEGLKANAEYHAFFLAEADSDAWYNAGGGVQRLAAPGTNPDAYVGSELGFKLNYAFCKNFNVEGGYAHFFAGDYVDDTGNDDDADWGYVQATMTF